MDDIQEAAQAIVDEVIITNEYLVHTRRLDNLIALAAEDFEIDSRDIRNQVHWLLYKADLDHAFRIRDDYLNYIPHKEPNG